MKRLIVCGAAMLALSACKGGWSSGDKETFLKTCTDGATSSMGAQKAKDYCECMLPKIQKRYPTVAEANKITTADAEMTKMAEDCYK